MNKYIVLIAVICAALFFASVLKNYEKAITGNHQKLVTPDIWIDPETQCQYFTVPGGITPRLGTDGFPLCYNQLPVGGE